MMHVPKHVPEKRWKGVVWNMGDKTNPSMIKQIIDQLQILGELAFILWEEQFTLCPRPKENEAPPGPDHYQLFLGRGEELLTNFCSWVQKRQEIKVPHFGGRGGLLTLLLFPSPKLIATRNPKPHFSDGEGGDSFKVLSQICSIQSNPGPSQCGHSSG